MFKWLLNLFRKRKRVAEFSSLDSSQPNIPFTGSNVSENALGLTNPDSVLSGTTRGTQNMGGPNFVSDPANSRMLVYDGVTDRVEFGKIGTGPNDWGLKVSQPNIDVRTATNSQLIFNSAQDTFKVVATGSIVSAALSLSNPGVGSYNSGQSLNQVAHGLSYLPGIIAFIQQGAGTYVSTPFTSVFGGGGTAMRWYSVYAIVDAQNVTLEIDATVTGQTLSFATGLFTMKYFLLQESVV